MGHQRTVDCTRKLPMSCMRTIRTTMVVSTPRTNWRDSRVVNRYVGNLAPMPGVFPDYPAPVIRNTEGGSEMTMMRWGMPPPPRIGGPPVTNIRNTSSPHWRIWLKPENRCLVPANSFAEYAPEPNPETKKKDVVWFALPGMTNGRAPLAAPGR